MTIDTNIYGAIVQRNSLKRRPWDYGVEKRDVVGVKIRQYDVRYIMMGPKNWIIP